MSLWVGEFSNEPELHTYLDFQYDENGNAWSEFGKHSGIGWFDHDFQEAVFFAEPPERIEKALEGCSYADSFVEDVSDAFAGRPQGSWNSILLLYDCVYDPAKAHPSQASRLRYVGTFRYTRDVDDNSGLLRRRIVD